MQDAEGQVGCSSQAILILCVFDVLLVLMTTSFQCLYVADIPLCMHRNVKMAAKETDFAKLASRRNIKKSVEPMYMKSKRITMFGDINHLNNKKETPLRSAWRVNHDERTDDKVKIHDMIVTIKSKARYG